MSRKVFRLSVAGAFGSWNTRHCVRWVLSYSASQIVGTVLYHLVRVFVRARMCAPLFILLSVAVHPNWWMGMQTNRFLTIFKNLWSKRQWRRAHTLTVSPMHGAALSHKSTRFSVGADNAHSIGNIFYFNKWSLVWSNSNEKGLFSVHWIWWKTLPFGCTQVDDGIDNAHLCWWLVRLVRLSSDDYVCCWSLSLSLSLAAGYLKKVRRNFLVTTLKSHKNCKLLPIVNIFNSICFVCRFNLASEDGGACTCSGCLCVHLASVRHRRRRRRRSLPTITNCWYILSRNLFGVFLGSNIISSSHVRLDAGDWNKRVRIRVGTALSLSVFAVRSHAN